MRPFPSRIDLCAPALGLLAAGVMFGPALQAGHTLQGGDLVLWVPQFIQTYREGLFFPRWFPFFYAGLAQQFQFLSQAAFTMVLVDPSQFHAAEFALDVVIATIGMWCLLRSWRLRPAACALGALAYPLSNHLLTWVQAGHLWKYDTTCWTPWLLWALGRGHVTGRTAWFAWAGAFLGLHLLGGDVQLAYYVGLVVAALTVGRVIVAWRTRHVKGRTGWNPRTVGRQVAGHALCLAVAAGFGAEVIQHYGHLLRTQETVAGDTAADAWRFSTEFSLPPEETLGLAVGGGIFGHSLDGPHYWGRSIARNTDDYLGVVAVCFALCAVYVRRDRRTLAWTCIGAAALVLAYGKYVPGVYRGAHALPFMGALRNPNRWLFVTALAISLLAALGVDAWLGIADNPVYRRRLRVLCYTLGGGAVVAGAAVVSQQLNPEWWQSAMYGGLSRGHADGTEVAYRFGAFSAACTRAWLLGAAWLGLTWAVLVRTSTDRAPRLRLAGAAAVLIVGADLAGHARPFLRTYDASAAFARTPLISAVQSAPLGGRTKMWEESPALRRTVNHRFPYFGVASVDVISSRRPPAYTAVLRAWREGRLPTSVVLRLFHVTTLLSPRALPAGAPPADAVGVFAGVHVAALRDAAPRAEVIGDFNVLEPPAILRRMAEPDFNPATELLLEERPPVLLQQFGGPFEGAARLESERPHQLTFTVTSSRPALLLVHDLYDVYWTATVDGQAATVLKANSMLRAVPVPAGTDMRVDLLYQPPRWPWMLTLAGWVGLGLGALASLIHLRRPAAGGMITAA